LTKIRVITPKEFTDLRWARFTDFEFARTHLITEISAQEVPRAMMGMPLAFIKVEGKVQLVALMGLQEGQNLLIDNEGKWHARHIPQHYLCYPFVVVENDQQKFVLCFDEASGLLVSPDDSRFDGAEPFFENGIPSDTIRKIADYLSERARRGKLTNRICELLEAQNLIKEWDLQVETDKGRVQVNNLYCIDEDRLNSLTGAKLAKLRDEDALTLAYGQLFSMTNVSLLASQFGKTAGSAQKLGFSLGETSDSLSFDNI
jgi:hypothetical protein